MGRITHWRSIAYLNNPDHAATELSPSRQLNSSLRELGLFDKLKVYMPILAEPHALGTDNFQDPVTVLCEVYADESFRHDCKSHFGHLSNFKIVDKTMQERSATIVRFRFGELNFEIVGQPIPVEEQQRFLLTVIKQRLLGLD